MPRLAWTDLTNSPGTAFRIVGELAPDFAGGEREDDPFDSARLRFAANLIVRTCSHLKLKGPFAVQPSREGNSLTIQCVVPERDDFIRLGEVTGGREFEASLWRGHRHFLLDNATYDRLLAIAGQPDGRGAGRRARAASRDEEEQRLRWGHDGRARRSGWKATPSCISVSTCIRAIRRGARLGCRAFCQPFSRSCPSRRANDLHPVLAARQSASRAGGVEILLRTLAVNDVGELDPGPLALVEPLARFVPPAKQGANRQIPPSAAPGFASALSRRGVTTLVVTVAKSMSAYSPLGAGRFRIVLPTDALCSTSDRAHDRTVDLFGARFSAQVEAATTEDIFRRW